MSALRRILLCIDGDEEAQKAEDFAIGIAESTFAEICALYVVDPELKKFAHEIYAIGRDEYRRYIDDTLRGEGEAALERFQEKAVSRDVRTVAKMRYGDPEEELLGEIEEGDYDLVVMGADVPADWRARLRPNRLPEAIFRKAAKSVVFVR